MQHFVILDTAMSQHGPDLSAFWTASAPSDAMVLEVLRHGHLVEVAMFPIARLDPAQQFEEIGTNLDINDVSLAQRALMVCLETGSVMVVEGIERGYRFAQTGVHVLDLFHTPHGTSAQTLSSQLFGLEVRNTNPTVFAGLLRDSDVPFDRAEMTAFDGRALSLTRLSLHDIIVRVLGYYGQQAMWAADAGEHFRTLDQVFGQWRLNGVLLTLVA